MPYYVAAPVPTAPNLNVAPILGAMSNANQQMSEAGKIIAGSVKDMGQQFQDKQDAEFYSQVNQYANDPVALAQAMQNGSINTRGVSQQALNDYTNKARDIAATYAVNREAQEKNYLNNQYMQHKDLLLQAQAAASKGDLEGAQKIYASAIERGMDPRVLKDFDPLSGYSTLQQLELAKQRNAIANAGLGLQGARLQYLQNKDAAQGLVNMYLMSKGGNVKEIGDIGLIPNLKELTKFGEKYGYSKGVIDMANRAIAGTFLGNGTSSVDVSAPQNTGKQAQSTPNPYEIYGLSADDVKALIGE